MRRVQGGVGDTSPMSPTTNDAILFLHFLFPAVQMSLLVGSAPFHFPLIQETREKRHGGCGVAIWISKVESCQYGWLFKFIIICLLLCCFFLVRPRYSDSFPMASTRMPLTYFKIYFLLCLIVQAPCVLLNAFLFLYQQLSFPSNILYQ